MLKTTFDAFDIDKKGYIGTDMIGTILDMLGTQLVGNELQVIISAYITGNYKCTFHLHTKSIPCKFQTIIAEIDEDGNGEVSFEEFAHMAARFLVEDEEDTEAIQLELKGAFRLYDKAGKKPYLFSSHSTLLVIKTLNFRQWFHYN